MTNQLLAWWRLHTGYTFLGEDIHVKPGRSDFNKALNETADPRHQFALGSAMNVSRHVEIDAAFRWVDSFRVNNGGCLKPFRATASSTGGWGGLQSSVSRFRSPRRICCTITTSNT